ncbi:ThiF family adenylyltransferase [Parapedobacter sp. ISTM3]|uniref:ThiF family adenylyltransferase n=1 Tax=Parapedobacter sp. ISTM3 TaxID=2800130 RepID=UPI001905482F|nr:ThiF family adenylyltransferase [Parapedobacter sp. ISTM3]MBK1439396.1 ThiF family adenylyltransferase [Parapedobacter sp. ISTM3]
MEPDKMYRPELLRLESPTDRKRYNELRNGEALFVYDTVMHQLQELHKIRYPSVDVSTLDQPHLTEQYLDGKDLTSYGVWVYYPWSRKLVHLVPDTEFYELRTNRNQLKISAQEQLVLKEKVIGIVGLSVGQSIALTMAMERVCGTLRLADFDTVELSNLNRIRTGVHNLGLNKAIIAAREVAELDPFINVEVFSEGLHAHNMVDFLTAGGSLDLLIEVCDNMEVKLKSRVEARKCNMPVIMETNDRGMLDIERFDLEPDRPLLHGFVDERDAENVGSMANSERMNIVKKIVNAEMLSPRMKQSFAEIGKTLRSWPQLASSVVLGGGVVTDVSRKVLLGEHVKSGRYYFDIDQLLDGH